MAYLWWGHKRIAVICRRSGISVSNRFVHRGLKAAKLLQRRRPRWPEPYQVARLFELLQQKPSDLWQADVTSPHSGSDTRKSGPTGPWCLSMVAIL